MNLHKGLDSVDFSRGTFTLVSALQVGPTDLFYRPLRERVVERVRLLCDTPGLFLTPQVVVATSPLHGPNALTLAAVSLTWISPSTSLPVGSHPASTLDSPPGFSPDSLAMDVVSMDIVSMDIVSMAYGLWDPTNPVSRFYTYGNCLKIASRLVQISHPKVRADSGV